MPILRVDDERACRIRRRDGVVDERHDVGPTANSEAAAGVREIVLDIDDDERRMRVESLHGA
jgi:hypothetical protein